MASSYDPTLPTDLDWIRFQIGDRGPTVGSRPYILDDAEIFATNAAERNKWMAAFRCGKVVLARGFGLVSKSVDGLGIRWGDGAESNYREHLQTLLEQGVRIQLPTNSLFEVMSVDPES